MRLIARQEAAQAHTGSGTRSRKDRSPAAPQQRRGCPTVAAHLLEPDTDLSHVEVTPLLLIPTYAVLRAVSLSDLNGSMQCHRRWMTLRRCGRSWIQVQLRDVLWQIKILPAKTPQNSILWTALWPQSCIPLPLASESANGKARDLTAAEFQFAVLCKEISLPPHHNLAQNLGRRSVTRSLPSLLQTAATPTSPRQPDPPYSGHHPPFPLQIRHFAPWPRLPQAPSCRTSSRGAEML